MFLLNASPQNFRVLGETLYLPTTYLPAGPVEHILAEIPTFLETTTREMWLHSNLPADEGPDWIHALVPPTGSLQALTACTWGPSSFPLVSRGLGGFSFNPPLRRVHFH